MAPLRSAATEAKAALVAAQVAAAPLAARVAALEADCDAKKREIEQLSAMCGELMGAAESKYAS